MRNLSFDFVIVGAGIVGLTIAYELIKKHKNILIIDKESSLGLHASGRNSGVLHAGFYYSPDSLKAKLTKDGNEYMKSFCKQMNVPLNECGKVVVASSERELETLHILEQRAKANGVKVEIVTDKRLSELEPVAKTYKLALWSPNTASVNPLEVLNALKSKLQDMGVRFLFNQKLIARASKQKLITKDHTIEFGKLINCAGLYADKIARLFDLGKEYKLMPFKGLYLINSGEKITLKRHIYPVPNIKNPFLGVHFTLSSEQKLKIGPTATPCLWREQYALLERFRPLEMLETLSLGLKLMLKNPPLARLGMEEFLKHFKTRVLSDAQRLITYPLNPANWRWAKPGIRAQLIDLRTYSLVQDFIIQKDDVSVHILNAVSPAFTASFAFAKYLVENHI
ncbi:MAG: L-2-hydroxyglutarate oxidase [Aquificaceae bacterium]|nr:L-2-hydroxyglutarate oxidase [Aquificaceae bacterium]